MNLRPRGYVDKDVVPGFLFNYFPVCTEYIKQVSVDQVTCFDLHLT